MLGSNKKTVDETKPEIRPEHKVPMHPNTVKTLKDQEIKRDALAARNYMVADDFTPGHDASKGPVSSAGYSQNTTNGSIQADGQPESLKQDSDDPDFVTREEAQENAQFANDDDAQKAKEIQAKADGETAKLKAKKTEAEEKARLDAEKEEEKAAKKKR